jgi:hypothetical protein
MRLLEKKIFLRRINMNMRERSNKYFIKDNLGKDKLGMLSFVKEVFNRINFDAERAEEGDSYIYTAQRLEEAIKECLNTAADHGFFKGITRFIAGPKAALYCRLNMNFSPDHGNEFGTSEERLIGTLSGIPIWVSRSDDVCPEALCLVYRDTELDCEGVIGVIYIDNIRGLD